VEYGEAKAVGDIGERRVAERLRAYCTENPPSGFLSNVLIRSGRMTAQLDHVLIDPYGILIVEVKVRNGRIRGTADEKKWTAVYGGMTKTFQNPLEQLRGQRNTLSKTLRGVSDPIDLDLIQGMVVFVDAGISALELDLHGRKHVTTVDRLAAALRERTTKEAAALTHVEVCRRYEQLRLLDQSADPAVQAAHAAYRGGASLPTPKVVALPTARPTVTFSGNPHRPGPPAVRENPFALKGSGRPMTRKQEKRLTAAIQFAAMCLLLLCVFTGMLGPILSAAIRSLTPSLTSISRAPVQAPR
jgi:hypothetical protein